MSSASPRLFSVRARGVGLAELVANLQSREAVAQGELETAELVEQEAGVVEGAGTLRRVGIRAPGGAEQLGGLLCAACAEGALGALEEVARAVVGLGGLRRERNAHRSPPAA